LAQFVYVDETEGTFKTRIGNRRLITVAALLVDEGQVKPLSASLRELADRHVGNVPPGFEFHAYEIWNKHKYWASKSPEQLIAVFDDLLSLLASHDVKVVHATVDKSSFRDRYGESWLKNCYLIALQFALEKIEDYSQRPLRVLVADENAEHQARAISMTHEMHVMVDAGVLPGRSLKSFIDSSHFINSKLSAGIQLADTVAYLHQRSRHSDQGHPNLNEAVERFAGIIKVHTVRWREPWPPAH